MKLSTSEYFIKEVYTSFKRNIWMTLASIFTVVLSLFILGFFSIVILNLNKMADTLESQVQISVYLKDDLSQEEIDETKETLSKIEGLQDIKFITREEAMENFKERLGDQQFLLDALDDTNPLPDSFSLTVTSPQQVKTIADTAAALDSVESASYSQSFIKSYSLNSLNWCSFNNPIDWCCYFYHFKYNTPHCICSQKRNSHHEICWCN